MSTCNSCSDFSCACPVAECITTLKLGTIALTNTAVYIHIEKQNFSSYIYPTTSDGSGNITLNLNSPYKEWYNSFDGLYEIYVMAGGYFCEGDKLTVTSVGVTWTTVGVTFKSGGGIYSTEHLQIIS